VVGLVAAIAIGSCGGSSGDGGSDTVACEQKQRDYVNRVLAPDQQTDVATTAQAVFSAPDFPQSMPYCSGTRPSGP
jgi:hypothetical protein